MPKEIKIKTPTLEAMKAVQPFSQKIGDFIEWLNEQDIQLCKREDDDKLWPVNEGREQMLARYFEIDLNAAERERCAILDAIRKG